MISIIIPAYNSADHISKCLDSIKDNTFKDYEIIIIDDASDDKTSDIIKGYLYDPRISLIRNDDNKGVSYCRNIGINKSKGEYICFIDSDDFIDQKYLEKLYERINETHADWVACSYDIVSSNKTIKVPYIFKESININDKDILYDVLFYGNKGYNLSSSCMGIYRKDVITENDIYFNEDIKYGEDLLFNYQFIQHCESFSYIDEALYHYRYSDNRIDFDDLHKLFEKLKIFNDRYNLKITISQAKYVLYQLVRYLSRNVFILNKTDRESEYRKISECINNDRYIKDALLMTAKADPKSRMYTYLINNPDKAYLLWKIKNNR